ISFRLPSPRQPILGIVPPGIRFLGNPNNKCIRLTPAQSAESHLLVTPFLMFVLRCFRMVLCTGFNGGEPWSRTNRQAPILYHFGQATNLRRLVVSYGASHVPLLALSIATGLQG